MDVVWFGGSPEELPSSKDMQERPPAEFRKELDAAGLTAAAPHLGRTPAEQAASQVSPEDMEVYEHWFSGRWELNDYTGTPPPELPNRVRQINASGEFERLMIWTHRSGEALLVGQPKRATGAEAVRWGVLAHWSPNGVRTQISVMRRSYRTYKAVGAATTGAMVCLVLAVVFLDISTQWRAYFPALFIILCSIFVIQRGKRHG